MRIERRYTTDGQSPYADIAFRLTTSEIRNPDGSVVFRADDVEVPAAWSQVASDVLAQKYFRKAGVPARLKKIEEATVPSWLWRSVADEAALKELPEQERFVGEHSVKPAEVHERIERLLAGPYLELFARKDRPGWLTWGNEIVRAGETVEAAVAAE